MNVPQQNQKVAGLATLSPGQLRIEWRRVFRSAPPALSKDLMARLIAWKLQVKAHGDVSAAVQGKQPASMTRSSLWEATSIPLDWDGQRTLFGFA